LKLFGSKSHPLKGSFRRKIERLLYLRGIRESTKNALDAMAFDTLFEPKGTPMKYVAALQVAFKPN